jgi:glutamate decarboxylase
VGSAEVWDTCLVFRERDDLPEDLVFYENYLGKRDATFTLNFSTNASMVLAQYYNFVRLGHDGYRYIMETMATNADALAERIAAIGEFRLIGADEERLPLVAFQLDNDHAYDEFDLASQLSAERGWMVPACTLPPNADHVKMMPALVKLTLGHTLPRPSLTTSPRPAGSWPTGDGCTSTTARA